ncbi:MAG: site-2 protease family protein, partial [Gemmatimonadota bacterium]|nr:site-2 protease family protein [Gemmatimonadota bacterium]
VLNDIALSTSRVEFATQHGAVTVPLGDSVHAADVAQALDYWTPAVVDSVGAGGPAAAGGMEAGDSILAVNGEPIPGFAQLVDKVSASAGTPLLIEVRRGTRTLDLHVTPKATEVPDPATGKTQLLGRIGIARREIVARVPVTFWQAVESGTQLTWVMGGAVIGTVRDLIIRRVSVSELAGPITITRVSVQAARTGLENLFYLIALLSINVAVLNLLPIPILDGGQIAMNVVETAKGKPFSLRTRENILRVGLAAIALLFAVVMYNDLKAWLGKLFS